MSGQKNDVTYAATVAFAVAKMRELGWMPPSNTSTDPPQDDLIDRLRAVEWEETDDCGRMPDDPTHKCVFVDMRPDDFRALLREAAAALEAAREDASEAKQNGYELGLLAASQGAAREDGWQPIETAPRDGTRVLLWYKWHDLPVVGEFRHGRWWSVHSLGGNLAYKQGMDLEEVLRPTHWRPLPAPPAIDQARGKGVAK